MVKSFSVWRGCRKLLALVAIYLATPLFYRQYKDKLPTNMDRILYFNCVLCCDFVLFCGMCYNKTFIHVVFITSGLTYWRMNWRIELMNWSTDSWKKGVFFLPGVRDWSDVWIECIAVLFHVTSQSYDSLIGPYANLYIGECFFNYWLFTSA